MSGNVQEISDDTFDQEVLKSSTPVLVDFWATWCGPCKALAPTIHQLATTYAGKIKFCKMDVDNNPNQAAHFGIRSIPTLILFQNGQPVGQLMGNVPAPAIEELFRKAG